MKPSLFAALLAALSWVAWTEQPAAKVDVVIHAGRVIDGVGTSPALQSGWE